MGRGRVWGEPGGKNWVVVVWEVGWPGGGGGVLVFCVGG